ncbi:hypothetical protein [Pedobacter sp. Leaf176]|uniref:hypothetical protein n=1 Tax=Pedobacter sp. Leaf176 TaxID=1736286 RepID=UPI0006F9B00A|nr:hypothetical protein [Pedobacter sp. Leaf176]KQR70517.1 hypothetical protein ASF92_11145 [Pedobacter sp. Leaf176]
MKKFLKIAAVIIISLLIFFVGAFKYRQYRANQVLIPSNAGSLVKISVDELYKSLAVNMITHPGYYFKSDTKTKKKTWFDGLDHGLQIPANLYLFTIKNQPKTALFSRLEIKNLNAFEVFLENILHFNVEKKPGGLSYAKSKFGNIAISYNSRNAAIVFTNEHADFDLLLAGILSQKNFIELRKSAFNLVRKATNHIVFSDGGHFATLNFDNGSINTNDELISETIVPAPKPFHRIFKRESAISFWLNADFKTTPGQTLKLKNTSLEQDSLTKYYKGYVDFEWINTIQQMDSIITYDYNDDFEKIEKVVMQKRDIPNFIVNIIADGKGLKNYLHQKNVIRLDSGVINKTVFPLYKVHVAETDTQLKLSTNENPITIPTNIQSDEFLGLNVYFNKLSKQSNFPSITKYIRNLQKLEIKGKLIEGKKVRITGNLTFRNKEVNSLYQLLKMR